MNLKQNYAEELGKLISNLRSLEFLLRAFLYAYHNKTKTESKLEIFTYNEGDEIICNEMTNYDTLGNLIDEFNKICNKNNKLDKDRITRLRDGLAHGRIVSPTKDGTMTLFKFSKPRKDTPQIVECTIKMTLDSEFFSKNIKYIMHEIGKVETLSTILTPTLDYSIS